MGGNVLSVVPQGVDPREVTVLQPDAWRRIQNSLSGYNEEKMRLQAKMREREELHTLSKEKVKHWENTIEVCYIAVFLPFIHFLQCCVL